jgi:L-histidine Nalpha-methyltransferase
MSTRETTDSAGTGTVATHEIEEIHYYLGLTPRQLPSRWLYDTRGSLLFEAICVLPWYRITRAEMRLLAEHGAEIGHLAAPTEIVELGCGNGQKLVTLLRTLAVPLPKIHLIDVSGQALERTEQALNDFGRLRISHARSTYEDGLMQLPPRTANGRRLVLFLGSNIGNFDPPGASEFIHLIRRTIAPGDWLLFGIDLVKPEPELRVAYDDPLGVTAAFNKNLLLRLNTELGANFNLEDFKHHAIWNRDASRVEMHLVSLAQSDVTIPGPAGPLEFTLEPGESIWTESSYKYEPAAFSALVESAGFKSRMRWVDGDARFLLALFERPAT